MPKTSDEIIKELERIDELRDEYKNKFEQSADKIKQLVYIREEQLKVSILLNYIGWGSFFCLLALYILRG